MERIAYGNDPLQFGELRIPAGSNEGSHPLAIVIHGGFWRAKYDLSYIVPVCEALTDAGIATWNIEYRRIGNPGGGFPGTLDDVRLATAQVWTIAADHNLDLNRIIAIGHSAGGHLAVWTAADSKRLSGVISLAGVLDLRRAWELKLSNTVVAEFLGGSPDEVPERYSSASPIEQLPLGISQVLIHGTADASVPLEIGERYARAAKLRGEDAQLVVLEGAGHFEVVDPKAKEFATVMSAARRLTSKRR